MMAVLPLWCASTLVAYLLGQAVLGPKHGLASLVMLGGFAAAILLALAGHPLPGIVIGAVGGGVCGALLVLWAGTLRWNGKTAAPTAAARAEEPAAELLLKRRPAPEPTAAASNDVTGPLVATSSTRPKETPASKASAARSGSYSAAKSGKKSKRKKSKQKKSNEANAAQASLDEESNVAVGMMLEETMGEDSMNRTTALGTVSRAEKTMAGFDATTAVVSEDSPEQKALRAASEAPTASAERPGRLGRKRTSSIPRGVFTTDEEGPIALAHPNPNASLVSSEPTISGFDDPTENLDSEIAPTHCPRCQDECTPEARYCAGCSAPVMPWSCKECGHQNHADADFCVRCQAPVELLASPVDVEILNE
jgi:hypothetical protein